MYLTNERELVRSMTSSEVCQAPPRYPLAQALLRKHLVDNIELISHSWHPPSTEIYYYVLRIYHHQLTNDRQQRQPFNVNVPC